MSIRIYKFLMKILLMNRAKQLRQKNEPFLISNDDSDTLSRLYSPLCFRTFPFDEKKRNEKGKSGVREKKKHILLIFYSICAKIMNSTQLERNTLNNERREKLHVQKKSSIYHYRWLPQFQILPELWRK